MASGIENAQCVVVFITRRYVDKVGGTNPEDNCQLEFNYASRRKGANKMIAVVMESRMADASSWAGEVGLVLGGRLYADMTGDFNDSAYLERCADDLYNRIMKVIGKSVPSFNLQVHSHIHPASSDRFADEGLPLPVHPRGNGNSPPPQPKKDTKPLSSLTVEEVSALLLSLRLGKFVDQLRENEVDGATLALCKSETEIVEAGVSMQLKARVLLAKIQEYKVEGVPLADIAVVKEKSRGAVAAVAVAQKSSQSSSNPKKETHPPQQPRREENSSSGHCARDSIGIHGATGPCSLLNGIYEITTETFGGMRRYKKKTQDHWLEYNSDQGRWHCKPGSKKGTLEAWAYRPCEAKKLPYESSEDWQVYDGSTFHPQSLSTYSAASFSVYGCVLSVLDGVYDPSPEMHNGVCRYRRRDGTDYWFEYSSTQQHWHITRTADKGTEQAFAYAITPSGLTPWLLQQQGKLSWKTFNGTTKAFDPSPDMIIIPEPKPLEVSGGSGPTAQYIAGIYDPTTELYGGWVRYQKRTDPDAWVEYLASQHQWHIKPSASKTQTNVPPPPLPPPSLISSSSPPSLHRPGRWSPRPSRSPPSSRGHGQFSTTRPSLPTLCSK
jgi:hypothetical protein